MSLSDAKQRIAALDIHRSFCVTAPAGSGKTELLTQRFLKLLAVVEEPEEVLAITFTRKARAEMAERIMRALDMALQVKPEQPHLETTWLAAKTVLERDALKNWNLLNNPKRLRIQTIDSLNQAIAGESPLLNGFGSAPVAVDNAASLYEQVMPRLLSSIHSEELIGQALRRVLLKFNSDTLRFSHLLNSLLARRDQWLQYLSAVNDYEAFSAYLQQTWQEWLSQDLAYAHSCLRHYEPDIIDRLQFAAKHTKDKYLQQIADVCTLPECTPAGIAAWQALTGWLTTGTGELRKTMQAKQGYPAQKEAKDKTTKAQYKFEKEQIVLLLAALTDDKTVKPALMAVSKIPGSVSSQQSETIADVLCVLKHAVAHLNIIFAETGECDHVQVALAALNLLDNQDVPSSSQLRWNQRVKHILVDEYQDTSFIQNTILAKLVALWDEARTIEPEVLRSLFVVGDGMQSIYRFRAANVGLFIQAQQQGVGLEPLQPLTLTQNFRSQADTVDWFNQTFSGAFPAKADIAVGAVPYTQAVSTKQGSGAVEVHGFNTVDNEAEFIGRKIAAIQADTPAKHCAVLARSKKHLLAVMQVLKRKGITYSSADIKRLVDIPAVVDLVSITQWVLNPANDIALAAIFRAPWCGATTQDLHDTKQQCVGPSSWFYQLQQLEAPELPERISRCLHILQHHWQQRSRKPLADAVEGLWLALSGEQCAVGSETYVKQYLQCLRKQSSSIYCELSLQRTLQNEFAQPATTTATVQLMTIHKSKGLEFDAVFLMGLAKTGRTDEQAMVEYAERLYNCGGQGVLLAPWGKTEQDRQLRGYVKHLEQQADAHELLRVLYVGATRAVSNLYLSFCYKQDEKSDEFAVKPPAKQSLIYSIWPMVEEQVIYHEPDGSATYDAASSPMVSNIRLKQACLLALPDSNVAKTADKPLDNTPLPETSETAFGTLMHEVLEYLSHQRFDTINVPQLNHVIKSRILYSPHIDNKTESQQLAETIVDVVCNTEQGRHIVFNHNEAHSEWPLTVQNVDHTISRYIIDKSFVEAGTRWIIDYKITQPKKSQSLDDFLQTQTLQYSAQLARYRYAVSLLASDKQSGYALKTALYFPLINRLHLISAE